MGPLTTPHHFCQGQYRLNTSTPNSTNTSTATTKSSSSSSSSSRNILWWVCLSTSRTSSRQTAHHIIPINSTPRVCFVTRSILIHTDGIQQLHADKICTSKGTEPWIQCLCFPRGAIILLLHCYKRITSGPLNDSMHHLSQLRLSRFNA